MRFSNIFGHCLIAKLVGQCIGDWHGYWVAATILKLGLDFGPGAVCDAVGTCKLVDVLVFGRIHISNCIEDLIIFGSHNFMTFDINW